MDFGDTLIDEGTERKARGVTYSASLLPGAEALLTWLGHLAVPVALVADGRQRSYELVLASHRLGHHFGAVVSSDLAGAEKPDSRPFLLALRRLDVDHAAPSSIIMIGNRLDRDIRGANRLGLSSIWLTGSPRYPTGSTHPDDRPTMSINTLTCAPAAIRAIDSQVLPPVHR